MLEPCEQRKYTRASRDHEKHNRSQHDAKRIPNPEAGDGTQGGPETLIRVTIRLHKPSKTTKGYSKNSHETCKRFPSLAALIQTTYTDTLPKRAGGCWPEALWYIIAPRHWYMECHGDLVHHSLVKYWRKWDEVGTKLVRGLTIAVRNLSKLLRDTVPKWSNIDPVWPTHTPGGAKRRRGGFCSLMVYMWSLRDCIS